MSSLAAVPGPAPLVPSKLIEGGVQTSEDVVRERYGGLRDTAAVKEVRPTIEGVVRDARPPRTVQASSVDEPTRPFASFHSEP